MEKNMPQKKKLWAGVVSGQIQFFNSDPQGTVEGLQGSRTFNLGNDGTITDDNGNNAILSAESGHGTDNAGSIEQSMDNQTSQPTPTA